MDDCVEQKMHRVDRTTIRSLGWISSGKTICLRLFVSLLVVQLPGCAPKQPVKTSEPYTGPTLALDELLRGLNERRARLPTVWASGSFELWARERETDRVQFVNGSLTVVFRSGGQLRLQGQKVSQTIFDTGISANRYWLALFADESVCWHGSIDPANPVAPTLLPIRPDALLDVIGLEPVSVDLIDPPVPTLRFNPDYDAYMVTWHVPDGDRWVTTREIWFDRATLGIRYVWLFNRDGKVIVRAKLRDELIVEGADHSDALLARGWDLLFVETGSTMNVRLEDVRLSKGRVPNDLSFRFDPMRSGAERVVDLDETAR
jgi:hypothetical protein